MPSRPSASGTVLGRPLPLAATAISLLVVSALALLVASDTASAIAAPAEPRAAIPAIVAAFAAHPVVAIAETHGVHEAGEFYVALVRDPAFQRTVDDIVVEYASRQSQPLLDRYVVAGDSLAPDTLATIWRNTTKVASWESPVYARWLAAIREVNRSLPAAHRLRVLAGDTGLDWAKLHTPADWAALGENDDSFARVILDEVLAKKRRALVVLGSNHLARGGRIREGTPNTTTRVLAKVPGAMQVLLLFAGWPGGDTTERRIAREAWPAPSVVPLAGSWIGALPVVRGPLEEIADGLLFLGASASLNEEPAPRASFDWPYLDELDRRSWIEWSDSTRARRFLGIGRVDDYQVASRQYGRQRKLWVYTPPGYSAKTTCDLLVAFDGGEYLDQIPLPLMLDTLLAAKRLRPTVAVLIDNATSTERLADLANRERFAAFLGDELIPWVRARWNVSHDPRHTIVTGSSAGGLAAANVALARPDLFGNVLSQSGAFWRGNEGSNAAPFEWLTDRYAAAPKRDLCFVLDVGALESTGAIGGTAPSILAANRRLRDVLVQKGYSVTYTEVPAGGHAPEFWRLRLADDLATLAQRRAQL